MKRLIIGIMILSCFIVVSSIPMIYAESDVDVPYYVMDTLSKTPLKAHRENERHEIASMVKIMTLNVVFDAIDAGEIDLNDKVLVSRHAASIGGSELFIDSDVEYPVTDLIKGVIVVSANDAATALAEYIANNEDNFVNIMNTKANEWGLANTHFVNPTGLPQDGQYSTAKDVSIMLDHLLEHEKYFEYAQIWTEDYTHPSGRVTNLTNTNKLVRFYDGCDGGKTGYTDNAHFCLSATAQRSGMRVIATVLGAETSKSRFKLTSDLFNETFRDYSYKVIKHKGDEIENDIEVRRARDKNLSITYARDISVLVGKNAPKVTIEYDLPDNVKAPIEIGDKIGECRIMNDGKVIDTIDIVAKDGIKKGSIFDNLKIITAK